MSKLSFRSSTETPSPTPAVESKATSHHVLLEATVRPVGTNDFKQERVSAQADALRAFRREGRDLFEMNETRKIQSAGTLLYQTTETYGTPVSIESMCETMQASDLTLRVNFKRPGVHSSTTCMELSAETLQKLLASDVDGNGHRTAELRIAAERSANVPRHGAIYVSISKKGTQHYLSHIDYKIMASYDAMYHD
jgi:hypothetical protein|tara:strand:+ start:5917 stop:6501 length:585 start_codon:yes stop_codon:yes gene_type:complete